MGADGCCGGSAGRLPSAVPGGQIPSMPPAEEVKNPAKPMPRGESTTLPRNPTPPPAPQAPASESTFSVDPARAPGVGDMPVSPMIEGQLMPN